MAWTPLTSASHLYKGQKGSVQLVPHLQSLVEATALQAPKQST